MPKYAVTIPQNLVSKSAKDGIAASIVRIHQEVTGSSSENVQVIIGDVEPGCFYQHGRLLECEHIFIHGFILQDRNRDTKSILTERLAAELAKCAGIDRDSVWIHFSEMTPNEMEQFDRYTATGPAGGSS